MITTCLVPVPKTIVEDPYSDLAQTIEQYALMQAQVGVNAGHESQWKVVDWSGPIEIHHSEGEPPGVVYYNAVVEETPKPGSRTEQLIARPIGQILVPMSNSLVDDKDVELGPFIERHAKDAARAAWESRNAPAKGFSVIDWTGPYDYMHVPGDLPEDASCFRCYIEVTR